MSYLDDKKRGKRFREEGIGENMDNFITIREISRGIGFFT